MNASPRAYSLIRQFEGVRLEAYPDRIADEENPVWTIGYGYTHGIKQGMTITEAQAEALLREEVERIEPIVSSMLDVPVTQGQFDALISFAYNLGTGALSRSTLLRKLNAGDSAGAAAEFPRWVHSNGVEVAGLVHRRKEERVVFQGENA